jgi:hypothetical protein
MTNPGHRARIIALLLGREEQDKRGLPTRVYLKEGSEEELEARRALACEFRSSEPLDRGLRNVLADLLDPDCDDFVDRKMTFKHRREGKRSNELAEKKVAEYILSKYHESANDDGEGQLESAIAAAAEKFGLKRACLFKIWEVWQPIVTRFDS